MLVHASATRRLSLNWKLHRPLCPRLNTARRTSQRCRGFERSTSLNTLCDQAAIEFRRLTNFDRVMIYRFLEDGVGCVAAEDRRADMHTFLNHHFPASDIPKQARDLYLRNLIRVIPGAAWRVVHG